MPVITFSTTIKAPIERCFDLARSINFHMHSMRATGELAVEGVVSGLIGPGQEVTREARHLGRTRTLTSRICDFDRPRVFADEMVKGDFASFRHEHRFEVLGPNSTRLNDRFEYHASFGLLGRTADAVFLTGFMRRLLQGHAERLRLALESGAWREWLEPR